MHDVEQTFKSIHKSESVQALESKRVDLEKLHLELFTGMKVGYKIPNHLSWGAQEAITDCGIVERALELLQADIRGEDNIISDYKWIALAQ